MTASVALKKGQSLPEILSEEEQKALLSVVSRRYPTGIRNYSLMLMMLDCGLRSSEVVNLSPRDLDLTRGVVTVLSGKGQKDRRVWACDRAVEAAERWFDKRADLGIDTEWFYCCITNREVKKKNVLGTFLYTSYLRQAFERYGERAGIEKRVHPHMLRHSFATDLYRQTKDIRMVQKALGHADLSSTMIYTHLIDEELENGMKALRR